MKKQTITLILSLLTAPLLGFGADTNKPNTNSIYFGAQGSSLLLGWRAGGYVGVQSNFGREDIALINTFGAEYASYNRVLHTILSHNGVKEYYKGTILSYTVGLRVILGTPYVFMDFNAGFDVPIGEIYKAAPSQEWTYFLGGIDLGFNIPLAEKFQLQIMGGAKINSLGLGYNIKLGLQILL